MPKKRKCPSKRKTVRIMVAPFKYASIVLPCRQSKLTPALKARVDEIPAKYLRRVERNPDACKIIFFTAKSPVVRCENRDAKGVWSRVAKERSQCRKGGRGWKRKLKRDPQAALFTKCP